MLDKLSIVESTVTPAHDRLVAALWPDTGVSFEASLDAWIEQMVSLDARFDQLRHLCARVPLADDDVDPLAWFTIGVRRDAFVAAVHARDAQRIRETWPAVGRMVGALGETEPFPHPRIGLLFPYGPGDHVRCEDLQHPIAGWIRRSLGESA